MMASTEGAGPASPISLRAYRLGLTICAAVGLVLRLATAAWLPTEPISDFHTFRLLGRFLAHGLHYPSDWGFPPGYPLALAGFYRLIEDELVAARAVNVILGVVFLLLAAAVARRLWGELAALFAAGLVALYPRYLLMTVTLASENLLAPLLMSWLLVLHGSWRRDRAYLPAALGGLIAGLMALTRSATYLLWFVWPLIGIGARRRWRPIVGETLLLLCVQHAVLAPWALWNLHAFGRLHVLPPVGGIDLFIGNSPKAPGHWYPWQEELDRIDPGASAAQPYERDERARRAATQWIRAHPRAALRLYGTKLRIILGDEWSLWMGAIAGEWESPDGTKVEVLPDSHPLRRWKDQSLEGLNLAWRSYNLLQFGGILVLIVRVVTRRRLDDRCALVAFVSQAAYFPMVAALFLGATRFRWPAVDLLMPLAGLCGAGLVELYQGRQPR